MSENKTVYRHISRLLIPIILENVLTFSAMLVSTAMVGRLMALDISAQGVAGRITNTYLSLFKGLAIGGTVVVALYFGQGKPERCRRAIEQAMLTGVSLGTCCAVLIWLFPGWFIGLFTSDAAIVGKAFGYLRILTFGLPAVALSTFITAAFQGQGNTRVPMIIAGLVNLVNVALGWLLIFGKLGAPKLGLTGAGIALVSAQLAGAALGLFLLYMPPFGLYARTEREAPLTKLDVPLLRQVYRTGIPASAENLIWQFATIIISRVILSYSTESYAAYQLGLQTEGICDMLSAGFVTASVTLAAQAIGKKDPALLKAYFWGQMRISMAITAVCCALLFGCPRLLMSLLTDKAELIDIGVKYVFIMGFAQTPQNISKILNGTIRAAGYTKTPMLVSFVGIWLVRVTLCCLFAWVFHFPLVSIWWAITIDQFVRMSLSLWVMLRRRILDTSAQASV